MPTPMTTRATTGSTMTDRLNPLTLPLRGSRLIEASAGTGKTWTIAALYLRLVLGHGGSGPEGQGPARPLLPSEVLVMTFTRAATRELSSRIRERLVQAAAVFRGMATPAPDDAFLAGLLDHYPEGAARQAAAWQLAMAAEAMDDAAVVTIDAWCQRMLREHAFDSACLFDEELQADEAAMLAEAARDYWRQQLLPLADADLATALASWPDVDALAASVRPLLNAALPAGSGQGSLQQAIQGAHQQQADALTALKQGWVQRADEMQAWLDAQVARKDCPLVKTKFRPAKYGEWLEQLRDWARHPQPMALPLTATACERFTPAGLAAASQPGEPIAPPECFAAFEALLAAIPQVPQPAGALRAHAAGQVLQRLAQLKAQAGTFGFADMLQRLHQALDPARHGDAARRLRQRIVAQFPVALVDEFQDTSPLQLGIFDRLYRLADTPPGLALLLIGDPKQAIYGFRGADIHSYLQARRATHGRHHVLGTNHRATPALVAAVNTLFLAAEARAGAGAFLYRSAPGDGQGHDGDPLPFVPAAARGRADELLAGGGTLPAVQVCLDANLRSKTDSRALHAGLCAERIVQLLNDTAAGFAHDGRPWQRLRPADIAVLVRDGTDAAAVQQALRRRGVASVYLSDKDSVFASAEAQDLLRLLQAMAAPRDMRLARAALATTLVGSTLDELVALASDDAAFDQRCLLLARLHASWQAQGVLAALRQALHAFGLPARWLAQPGGAGERRLTNVLHLAELLQAASAQLDGEQALIRWLSQQLADAAQARSGSTTDEQVLRLESDANLVQVVTVHKSKGLEYPLVFVPFGAHFRAVTRRDAPLTLGDGSGRPQLLWQPTPAQVAARDQERLREDLRLLYVALTRARHGLWLGLSLPKRGSTQDSTWHRSAIGQLVTGALPAGAAQVAQAFSALQQACGHITLVVPQVDVGTGQAPVNRLQPRDAAPPLLAAPAYSAAFDRQWAISSYSALVKDTPRQAAQPVADPVPAQRLRDDEPGEPDDDTHATRLAADQPWHRFPRGALPGNFLHGLLEWLAGEGFALADTPVLQQALLRRCEQQGWGHRADDVLAWLGRVCHTPLPPLGVALAGLDQALPEMEFWLPGDGLTAGAVDALCCRHLLPGQPRPALPERALHGMLMGFADLVFAHNGRYGVLDYKSNALGTRDADYTPQAMQAAVLAHRYDVQAALYLLALHRLLKQRLRTAYRPAAQLQGAVFLFLRGIHGPGAGACALQPPLALIESLDALLAPQPAGGTTP
jgi:exodeoxyribonuclease V beta subunit